MPVKVAGLTCPINDQVIHPLQKAKGKIILGSISISCGVGSLVPVKIHMTHSRFIKEVHKIINHLILQIHIGIKGLIAMIHKAGDAITFSVRTRPCAEGPSSAIQKFKGGCFRNP